MVYLKLYSDQPLNVILKIHLMLEVNALCILHVLSYYGKKGYNRNYVIINKVRRITMATV